VIGQIARHRLDLDVGEALSIEKPSGEIEG